VDRVRNVSVRHRSEETSVAAGLDGHGQREVFELLSERFRVRDRFRIATRLRLALLFEERERTLRCLGREAAR